MQMPPFAFDTTDWMRLEPTEHAGESGVAFWRTRAAPFLHCWMKWKMQ